MITTKVRFLNDLTGSFSTKPLDRYRHTSHLEGTEEVKDRVGGGEGYGPMLAKEAAVYLILVVLSKLGTSWMREPKRLSGWEDGL